MKRHSAYILTTIADGKLQVDTLVVEQGKNEPSLYFPFSTSKDTLLAKNLLKEVGVKIVDDRKVNIET